MRWKFILVLLQQEEVSRVIMINRNDFHHVTIILNKTTNLAIAEECDRCPHAVFTGCIGAWIFNFNQLLTFIHLCVLRIHTLWAQFVRVFLASMLEF
jgi:hypothetical protein